MSEDPKRIPISEFDVSNIIHQNQLLGVQNKELSAQLEYLQRTMRELVPVPPAPKFPNTDMPASPVIAGLPEVPPGSVRADGEGRLDAMPTAEGSPVTPPAPGKMRIMIGIPMLAVSYEFFVSFLKFWTELCLKRDPRYEITYLFAYRKPVHMAEEWLVKQALFNKCTHILFMDDDIFDVTAADLNKLVDANKDFISGVMHASQFPHAQCTFRRYDTSKRVIDMPADNSMYRLYEIPALCTECGHPQTHWDVKFCPACGVDLDIAIQPVDLVPFPFTLMNLDIFKKIKEPWFHCTNGYPTDSWFCDRCLEAGIQPYAHMTVRLNHAGVTDVTKPHFMQMGMAKAQMAKSIVHLSPEQMDIHQNLLFNKMQAVEAQARTKPPIIADATLVANEIDKGLTLQTIPLR